MSEPLKVEVPAIALLGNDRILRILQIDAVDDEPERDVDWTVTGREERVCVEHGRWHLVVAYTEPDSDEGTRKGGKHTFDDPSNTWLKVERPVGSVLSEGSAA